MRITALVLLLAVLASTTSAQEQGPIVTASVSAYTLRPGDVLNIEVWGQEEFSGRFQIDETGRIHYPVLGELNTTDLTVAQVRDSIRSRST